MVVKKINFLFLSFTMAFSMWSMQVNGSRKEEVTKEYIRQHENEYKIFVYRERNKINLYEWIIVLGAKSMGYNSYSISCVRVAYKFFKDEEKLLGKTLDEVCKGNKEDINYIKEAINIFNKQKNKGKDVKGSLFDPKNELVLVLHKMHVNSLSLPEDVDRKSLVENPELFKEFVDKGDINLEEYYRAGARNLFIQFFIDNKN